MKILFLRPSAPEETIGLQHLMIVEPLELELLATLVEKEHEVIIIDLILEKQSAEYFIKKYMPDMVCITGYITHTSDMLKISQKAKEINSKIITVAGGVYIEKLPEKINSPFVDYRVVRNALLE
ncbi:MAG: cobalamin B12-binding domain-containing protein, partial [Bacteroidales bacterium]|nr:cobalamin B12-binding domain-containing protein [Bacteroidales bacterium]